MKFYKKLISGFMCATMILTASGCSSCSLPFGNDKGDDVVALAQKTNVDAVFKQSQTYKIDLGYISSVSYTNGHFVAFGESYDFGDEGEFLPEKPVVVYEDSSASDLTEGEEESTDEDAYETTENQDATEEYDGEAFGENEIHFKAAVFTDENDVKYTDLDLQGSFMLSNSVVFDSEGNCYFVSDEYTEDSEKVYLWKTTPDFQNVEKCEIKLNDGDDYFSINKMLIDKNGNVVVQGGNTVMIYNGDLQRIGYEVGGENLWYSGSFKIKDGSVYISAYEDVSGKSLKKLFTIDDSLKLKEIQDESLDDLFDGSPVEGDCYDFLYRTGTSVWGKDIGKDKVEIVNFFDSDINPNEIGECKFIDSEHFYTLTYADDGNEINIYEKVPADQVKNKKIVTAAVEYIDYEFSGYVINFNKSQDEYKIRLVDYSEFNTDDDYEAGHKRFNSDLVSGNACDIIMPNVYDVDNLIDKGVFADLTPIMEQSGGFKKGDLVSNCANKFARDDKLYVIFPDFYVYSYFMLSENYKPGMTLDDVIAWEKATGNKALSSYSSKEGVFSNIIYYNIDNYLDVKSGKCNFDSPEFIAALKYANTYPSESSFGEEFYETYDWSKEQTSVGSGLSLMDSLYIENAWSYWGQRHERVMDKDITFCSYIGGSGDAGFLEVESPIGISASSENKEAAMKFIDYVFEQKANNEYGWGFSSLQTKFDEQIAKGTRKQTWIDWDGQVIEDDYIIFVNNEEVVVDPMTEAQAEELKNFILGVTRISYYDSGINQIISEEAEPFFAGQKTAEEVAQIIQSKVQIYVNEKK